MPSYVIRHIDSDALIAFRGACRRLDLQPERILRDFLTRVSLTETPTAEVLVTVDLTYPRSSASAHAQ